MRFLLALRAIFFVLLLPGTVAGYIPFGILRTAGRLRAPRPKPLLCRCRILAIAGAIVLAPLCLGLLREGKGTLAPIDPPRRASSCWSLSLYPKSHVQRRSRHSSWARRGSSVASRSSSTHSWCSSSSTFSSCSTRSPRSHHSSANPIAYTAGSAALGLHHAAISRGHREHRLTCRLAAGRWADRIRRSRRHCEIIPVLATVYVETRIVSYMTARPSRDVVRAAHQAVTRTWPRLLNDVGGIPKRPRTDLSAGSRKERASSIPVPGTRARVRSRAAVQRQREG